MTLLSFLLALVASFLGIDTSNTRIDVDLARVNDGYCATYDEIFDEPVEAGDYSRDWYTWEDCLTHGGLRDTDHDMTRREAQTLTAQVWADYLPWMAQTAADSYSGFRLAPDGVWWYAQTDPADWAPPVPELVFGVGMVRQTCTADADGCAVPGTWPTTTADYAGELTWDTPTETRRFGIYRAAPAGEPARVVLTAPHRLMLLHEVAHLINDHRWLTWSDNTPIGHQVSRAERERTGGHDLSFRCVALDLYRRYSEAVPADAYMTLSRLCDLYDPGPVVDTEPLRVSTLPPVSEASFSDVEVDHPAYVAVQWAAATGVTTGYEDGTFRPDVPLSRWQAVTFIGRYFDQILQAGEADHFTRADMMRLLYEIAHRH